MKVHLGCGKRHFPGWVHVDQVDLPHIDHRHDVRTLPFLDDEVADVVYASHVFEYFDRQEAPTVLAEWRRVLKPGGVLRLAVPDFPALVEVYRRSGGLARVLGPLFGRIEVSSPAGPAVIYHKTVYDFADLQAVLESAGFAEVRRYEWRETEHADYDDHSQAYYPHMEKDSGLLISLNVEATRKG